VGCAESGQCRPVQAGPGPRPSYEYERQ